MLGGDVVRIVAVRTEEGRVTIGIEAENDVVVLREELLRPRAA